MSPYRLSAAIVTFVALVAPATLAQDAGAPPTGGADASGAPDAAGPPDVGAPPGAGVGYGAAPPGASGASSSFDVNAGLDASSRPANAGAVGRDGFDFRDARGGATTIRGSNGGGFVVTGQFVPELHTAKRGDTLWEISQRYFGNSYNWPRLWSYNRQIQNPHWIYPGDHIRLREPFVQQTRLAAGLAKFNPKVAPTTVFQRHLGYLLDGRTPAWGEIVGSPDDQMILSQNDMVYVQLQGDREYKVGQKLVVFEPRVVDAGTDYPHVWVRGVLELDRVNGKTKMARARVVESLSEIHRGCKVAPFERGLDTIAPVPNRKTVQAKIVGSIHPFEFYATDQVVFIDKGSDDGLEVGNRLVAVQRADRWIRDAQSAGGFGRARSLVENDAMASVEDLQDSADEETFPAETYGELIVTRVRAHTATCLIVGASYEIPRGAVLLAREGY